MKFPVDDLVVLHLQWCEAIEAGRPAPYGRSVPGLCDALAVNRDRMAECVELLTALTALQDRGLVIERATRVEDLDEKRNVYELTAAGRTRATELLDRIESDPPELVVHEPDGRRVECSVWELDRYFETSPLVSGLARATETGVLSLESTIRREFVDREREVRSLRSLPSGDDTTAFVEGTPGVGKTELVEAARSRLEADGVEVLVGTCSAETAEPYEPFARALGRLPAPMPGGPTGKPDDEAFATRRAALFRAVADRLRERADGGVVLVLEDLHWADSATIDMLAALVDELEPADGVRLVGTCRTGTLDDGRFRDVVSAAGDRLERLEVEPFDRGATRELIEQVLGTRDVPASFVDRVHEATGGLPLFVEKVVEQLLDAGVVAPDLGVYPDDPAAIDVPDGVRAGVDRRLEALDDDALALLEWGAVAGDPIPIDVLLSILDPPAPTLVEYVDALVDARFWQRDDGGALAFASGVIRRTVLDRLDDDRQRRIHETIADALVAAERGTRDGETTDEVVDDGEPSDGAGETADGAAADGGVVDDERIARHLERAGAHERAVERYLRAGERALDVYASDVAIDRFRRAASIARDRELDDRVVDAVVRIGRASFLAGDHEAAEKHLAYVRERADGEETRRQADRYRARIHIVRGEYEEAIELAEAGLDRWDGREPTPEVCQLLNCLGWALMERGDLQAATERYERARDLARELDGDDEVLPVALVGLGTTLVYRNEHEAAIETLERAASLLEGSDRRRLLARVHNNLGVVHHERRELARAKDGFERAMRIFEEVGDRATVSTTMMNVGLIAFEDGAWEEAIERYEESLERATELDLERMTAFVTGNLAAARLYRGELDEAKRLLDRSISLHEELGMAVHVCSPRIHRVECHYVQDDLDPAVEGARRCIRDAAEIGDPSRAAPGHAWLGRVALERGDPDAAITHLERAVRLGDEKGGEFGVNARCILATALLETGRLDDAALLLDDAESQARERGNDLHRIVVDRARGRHRRRRGDPTGSRRAFERALETAVDLGARLEEARTHYELGLLARERGATGDADEHVATVERLADECGFERLRRLVAEETSGQNASEQNVQNASGQNANAQEASGRNANADDA